MKPFKELDLTNAYLFAAALSDEETCRLVLEMTLGFPVPKVRVSSEHTVLFNSDFRSVRLDVYARDEVEVTYNLEMQAQNRGDLAKRSRYYQAQMDVMSLEPGEDFNGLKPSYVIFICTFDPFGEGLYRYVFRNYCVECDLELGDETWKIFLNTKGKISENVPESLMHFLKYVEDSTERCASEMQDAAVLRIHHRVEALKKSREMEVGYMTMQDLLDDCREDAIKEGFEEGRKAGLESGLKAGEGRLLQLIAELTEDGRIDEMRELAHNEGLLGALYKEYNL